MYRRCRLMAMLLAAVLLMTAVFQADMQTARAQGFFRWLFGMDDREENQIDTLVASVPEFGEGEETFEMLPASDHAETPVHELCINERPEIGYYAFTAEVPGAYELRVAGAEGGELRIIHATRGEQALWPTDETGEMIVRLFLEVGDTVYMRLVYPQTTENEAEVLLSMSWLSYYREDALQPSVAPEKLVPKETEDIFWNGIGTMPPLTPAPLETGKPEVTPPKNADSILQPTVPKQTEPGAGGAEMIVPKVTPTPARATNPPLSNTSTPPKSTPKPTPTVSHTTNPPLLNTPTPAPKLTPTPVCETNLPIPNRPTPTPTVSCETLPPIENSPEPTPGLPQATIPPLVITPTPPCETNLPIPNRGTPTPTPVCATLPPIEDSPAPTPTLGPPQATIPPISNTPTPTPVCETNVPLPDRDI